MQQYVAAAKAASDRAQAIAAALPNDSVVQQSASLAKKFSDLAEKMTADEIKRRETMKAKTTASDDEAPRMTTALLSAISSGALHSTAKARDSGSPSSPRIAAPDQVGNEEQAHGADGYSLEERRPATAGLPGSIAAITTNRRAQIPTRTRIVSPAKKPVPDAISNARYDGRFSNA
jgi:hypothetical protein